ncbi:MAG: phytanoyl-CoA dioxygenase family protein [Planctomycetota bacterium]
MSNVTIERIEDALTEPYPLTAAQIEQYQRDGFIQLDDVVTGADLQAMRDAVAEAVAEESKDGPTNAGGVYAKIFNQKVNLWARHPEVARYALSRRLGDIAARLEGRTMRIWHDQALFKEPHQDPGNPTPWHQDAPYWPHADRQHSTSIWIALKDATPHNGCMTMLPGTQNAGPLKPVDLDSEHNASDLIDQAPQYKGVKGKILPLKAGSCTFHNGCTFHYAGANQSDDVREAFVVIYMPEDQTYTGEKHVVTDPLDMTIGGRFADDVFPVVGRVG